MVHPTDKNKRKMLAGLTYEQLQKYAVSINFPIISPLTGRKYKKEELARKVSRYELGWKRKKTTASKIKKQARLTPAERRKIIMDRGKKCQLCGKPESKTRLIEVHHIKPVNELGYKTPKYLSVLCVDCHRISKGKRVHSGKVTREKLMRLNRKYL